MDAVRMVANKIIGSEIADRSLYIIISQCKIGYFMVSGSSAQLTKKIAVETS